MSKETLRAAADEASAVLSEFETLLAGLPDASLHLADPEGGWTVAQVVSHVHLSGLLWLADLERMRHVPELVVFREELGHDALGAPPPSSEVAAARMASLRRAMADCLPAADPAVLEKDIEFAPFGRMTVGALQPLIVGHLRAHVAQATAILRSRDALPEAAP